MIKIRVSGTKEVDKILEKLSTRVQTRVNLRLTEYVTQHLVSRIKSRLAHGNKSHVSARGQKGLIGKAGGYGLPKNAEQYAEWKATRRNLPLAGSLSTRELVATGHFVDNIAVTKAESTINSILFEVGPRNVSRPKTYPFRNQEGSEDSADVTYSINNVKLAQMLEDSNYKFWATEFEDVRKELEPFLELVIRDLIKELVREYGKVFANTEVIVG